MNLLLYYLRITAVMAVLLAITAVIAVSLADYCCHSCFTCGYSVIAVLLAATLHMAQAFQCCIVNVATNANHSPTPVDADILFRNVL